MELIKSAFLPNGDGTFTQAFAHPATRVLVSVVIILILIFASGYVMRIISHAVREYKNLQAAIRTEVQVVRVPV